AWTLDIRSISSVILSKISYASKAAMPPNTIPPTTVSEVAAAADASAMNSMTSSMRSFSTSASAPNSAWAPSAAVSWDSASLRTGSCASVSASPISFRCSHRWSAASPSHTEPLLSTAAPRFMVRSPSASATLSNTSLQPRMPFQSPVVGGVVRLVQGGRGHLVGLLVVGDGGPDGVGRGPGDVVGQLVQVVANLGHRVGVRSGDPVEHAAVAELGLVADVQHAEARAA